MNITLNDFVSVSIFSSVVSEYLFVPTSFIVINVVYFGVALFVHPILNEFFGESWGREN